MRLAVPVFGVLALSLSGCFQDVRAEEREVPTPYQPMAWDGGYSDFKMGPGRYHIEVKGNAFSARDRITGYFYKRSLELCQTANFQGFELASENLERREQDPSKFVTRGGATASASRWGASSYGSSVTQEIPGERRFQASGDIVCTDPIPQTAAAPLPAATAPSPVAAAPPPAAANQRP